MSKLLLLPILALLAVLVSAPTTGAQSDPPADTDNTDSRLPISAEMTSEIPNPSEGVQSPEDALAEDMALEAESRGWTVEQVKVHREDSDVAGWVAAAIREQRSDVYVGLVLSSEPAGPAYLYIKGPADDFVHSLVDKADAEIEIVDNQPFSEKELDAKVNQVTDSLASQGYRDSSVWYDLSDVGKIKVEVGPQAGLPLDPADISSALPADVRDAVTITVSDSAVGVDQDAFGGMALPYGGYDVYCTSGWSVWNGSGTTGVTTAAHCGNGINQINDPATGLVPLTYQSGHLGQWGDVEWLTSNQLEPGRFYKDASTPRYVTAVKPASDIYVGQTVCFYGRASNNRRCSTVEAKTVSCLGSQRLVRMSANISSGGDSGGGWSDVDTAFGSHKGLCSSKSVFSVADYFDEALGVTVRVAKTLPTGGVLVSGDSLVSADNRFTAVMQPDGNFVIYRNGSVAALWASSWCGQTVFGSNILGVMQPDGNFVMYPQGSTTARWATSWAQTQPACISNRQTVFGSGFYMVMQDDGNLVIYGPGGWKWASNTCCY